MSEPEGESGEPADARGGAEGKPVASSPPAAAPRSAGLRWTLALAGVAAYGLATWLPLPGVDREALAALGASSGGGLLGLFDLAPPLVSPFGGMLALLVVLRALVRLTASGPGAPAPFASRVALLLFVAGAALRGWGIALYLESATLSAGPPLVAEPGLSFRMMAVVSFGAAAALTWQLATWLGRTRVAQGPLLLLGAKLVVEHTLGALDVGRALSRGEAAPLGALLQVVLPVLPLIAVAVALRRRSPARWPVALARGLTLTGPLDALVFPYLASFALSSLLLLAPGLLLEAGGSALVAGVSRLLELGLAGGLWAWWSRVPGGRGSGGWLVLAALAVPVALAQLAGGVGLEALARGGAVSLFGPRGPFDGDERYVVELAGEARHAAHDAAVLERRFEALGVEATVRGRGRRLVVELDGVREVERLLALTIERRELSFRLIALDQGALAPGSDEEPPAGVAIERDRFGTDMLRVFAAPTEAALAPVLARPGVVPAETAIECTPPYSHHGPPRCLAWRLEAPVLTGEDIAGADVGFDPMDGRPHVMLEMTEAGAERFAEVTARSLRRRLAIVLDGRIQSSPVIQSRIAGGRAMVTLGRDGSPAEQLAEARALEAALRSGALRGTWSVARRTTVR